MWGQDAEAMYGYAATAATATEALLPFEDAPLITNPGGLLEQAVAVEEASDTAAANQLMNNVPQALQQLAQPTKSIWPFDQLSELWKAISPHLSPLSNIVSMLNNHVSMTNSGVSMASTLHSMLKGFAPAAAQAVETAAQNGVQAMSSLGSQLGSSLGSSGLGAGVAANLGRAASVGSLSVPQAWAAANQAVTPAIAVNEAEYGEMWAQDAAAMFGYAAATATLLPFEEAPEMTSAGGLLEQAAAVEEASDTAAANQLMNNVPQALQQLAQPTQGTTPSSKLGGLWKTVSPHRSPISNMVSMANNHMSMTNSGVSMTNTLSSMLKGFAPAAAAQAVQTAAQNGVRAMSSLGSSLGSSGLGAGVAANLGRAASVGSLSVPQAWAAANQAVTPAARALPLTSLTSAAERGPGQMLGGLPVGQMGARAGGGLSGVLRVPPRPYVMPHSPAAG
ncbi:PE/PPE C-terminal domain-containing protein [Mycobacterium tuberculosis]